MDRIGGEMAREWLSRRPVETVIDGFSLSVTALSRSELWCDFVSFGIRFPSAIDKFLLSVA